MASDGRRATASGGASSLVILDLMALEISGLDVCRAIRAESDVPIIMVTAKDSEADKVAARARRRRLRQQPFSVRELVSRVRAHLRRAGMRRDRTGGGRAAWRPRRDGCVGRKS